MHGPLSNSQWFVYRFAQGDCCFFYNPSKAKKDETTGKVESRVPGCAGWDEHTAFTEEQAHRHLERGEICLGSPTTFDGERTHVGIIDYDAWEPNASELAKALFEAKLPGIVVTTRSGRSRIFVRYVDAPVKIETSHTFMEYIRDQLGLPQDPKISEIFPPLRGKNQTPAKHIQGSNVWLPYRANSNEVAYDPETGTPVSFEEFRNLWDNRRQTTSIAADKVAKLYVRSLDQSGDYDDGDDANAACVKQMEQRCKALATGNIPDDQDYKGRNDYLARNSRVFFGYAAHGHVTNDEVWKAWYGAAKEAGLDHDEIRGVLQRMKFSGQANPLKFVLKKKRRKKGLENIDDEPGIRIVDGELPRVVDEAEQALLLSGIPIYQRAGRLVRPMAIDVRGFENKPTKSWCLTEVKLHNIIEDFTRASVFWKYDMRAGWVRTNCPKLVAETYMARSGHWKVPTLHTVVNVPVLLLDGTVIDQRGLHESGILYEPETTEFKPIPMTATREDADKALQLLRDLIKTFPFVSPEDESVAIAMYMTSVLRPALPTSPMFAVTAYKAGSGKTKLVEMAGCIASGRVTPATNMSKSDEEFEKGLKSAFLSGSSLIAFDNLDRPIESGTLCTALTAQGQFKVRGFGNLTDLVCVNTATVMCTGNNIEVRGDLMRRTLTCGLDPRCAHPETRKFTFEPVTKALGLRVELVDAIFTIARAYQQTDDKVQGVVPLGNFETWSEVVREAIIWLGMKDPCDTSKRVEENDRHTNNLEGMILSWPERDIFDGDPKRERPGIVTVRTKGWSTNELIKWARPTWSSSLTTGTYPMWEAMLSIAPGKKEGEVDTLHLANWIRKHQGEQIEYDRIVKGEKDQKANVVKWVLERHLPEQVYEDILAKALSSGDHGHATNGKDNNGGEKQKMLPGIWDQGPGDDEDRVVM